MGRLAGTDQTEARVRSRQLEVQEWSSGERCGPETEVVESLCIDTPYSMEQVGAPGQGEIKWLGSTENGNPGALQWWQAGKEIPENETEWQMKEDTNITTSKENGFKRKKGGGIGPITKTVLIGEQSWELKIDHECVTRRILVTLTRWGSAITGIKVWWERMKGRTWAVELGTPEQFCRKREQSYVKTADGQDWSRETFMLFYLGKITAYLCIAQIIWWQRKLE